MTTDETLFVVVNRHGDILSKPVPRITAEYFANYLDPTSPRKYGIVVATQAQIEAAQ